MISQRHIISGSAGPIFTIFMTSFLRYVNVVKMYQRRLIPLAFGALVLENELQYHGLVVCNMTAYDACIS